MYRQDKANDNLAGTARQTAVAGLRWSALKWLPRAAFVGLLFLSSLYCVLAYIPTTYYAFIQAPFLGWMPVFARVQPYLFVVTLVLVAASLRDEIRNRKTRGLAAEFYFGGICAGVYLLWARPVEFLRNETLSFVWALAFLLPVIILGALGYISHLEKLQPPRENTTSLSYSRVLVAALWVSVLYPGTAFLRFLLAGLPSPLNREEAVVWLGAACTHTLLFLFVFGCLELCSRMAERSPIPARTRFLAYTALAWAGVAFAFFRIVLASIPFAGTEATLYSGVFSLAAVSFAGSVMLQRKVQQNRSATAGPNQGGFRSQPYYPALGLLLIFTAALIVPLFIGLMDWHSVLEKTWATMLWVLTAAVMIYRYPRRELRHPTWPIVATVLLSLAALRAASSQKIWSTLLPKSDIEAALQKHAAVDASYAAASDLLRPANSRPCNRNCEFITHQTNIPASAFVDVQDVSLVPGLKPVTGAKPNIFVIVVDSLRRDYLSAYNPDVFFTPEIGAFAKDSVVFRNAFTRYSGTTLSEPAIWSGTMQLHKHYVQPFHRVNNMEKMVQVDGYQSMVSVDTVLRVLLQPQPGLVQLDENAEKWTDLDFCSTQAEVSRRIRENWDRRNPIFMYTQPQNVHLVTLRKTSRLRPPAKPYPGFVDYYASELERLDGCFGSFIKSLKVEGLYENSIIVLTADHGEALDRTGAERHAFSLKPDVIRIPLIIHVPRKVRDSWYYAPDAIAFNTDITPTIYQLLGHGPVIARPEFGRPLFTTTRADSEKYNQSSYLIASSYGFLYGLLSDNGGKLFVDNQGEDEFFDLRRDPGAAHGFITEQIRQSGEATLASDIQAIANLYGYQYRPPTLLDWLMR